MKVMWTIMAAYNIIMIQTYRTVDFNETDHFDLEKCHSAIVDFKMKDFTGDDIELKNIGKGPSPERRTRLSRQ